MMYSQSVRAARTTTDDFRRWLRSLREAAGLTQEELAVAVGTDRRNIRRWEVDGHDPSGTMLLRILGAVGAKVEPPPPGDSPGAVNAELQELGSRLGASADDAARRHDELLARLDAQASQLRELSSRLAGSSSQT